MSSTPTTEAAPRPQPPRRVRHQARDVVAVMVFSLVVSLCLAIGCLLLMNLGR